MTEAAGIELAVSHVESESGANERSTTSSGPLSHAPSEPDAQPENRVALAGLDPAMLVEGREEMGKPEIVEDHNGFRYQFTSEPNRARFARNPDRYSMQNETCPVVPGATIDPDLFLVHEGRIYTFATDNCREEFKASPDAFLPIGKEPDE